MLLALGTGWNSDELCLCMRSTKELPNCVYVLDVIGLVCMYVGIQHGNGHCKYI